MKEFDYIRWMQKQLRYPHEVVIKSGDDAAGIRINNKLLLVTTDLIVEGIDFCLHPARSAIAEARRASGVRGLVSKTQNVRPITHHPPATPFQIGYKALAVSLSDIAAMGGTSRRLYAVATVALRKELSGKFSKELFRGMKTLARKFKVTIIGGDVSSVNGPVSIGVTILGVGAYRDMPIQRGGAKSGDAIMVTGHLGGSILGKHLSFTPRLKEARFLARNYRINSMIDISDGLLLDLDHILEASRKGAILFEGKIPISQSAQKISQMDNKSLLLHSLSDGEDFELLFTLPATEAARLLRDKPFKTPVLLIGMIQPGEEIFLQDKDGKLRKIKPMGYEHF